MSTFSTSSRTPDLETVEAAWEKAATRLLERELEGGGWEGEVVWCPILPAQYVISCHLTGLPLPGREREAIFRQFAITRHKSGFWGLHPESPRSLFVTALVYVASRLMGASPADPNLRRALEFVTEGRGVAAIPTWGKFWLALLNLFEWRGVNPVLPEAWLLPTCFPFHPSRFYCHTRHIYAPMAVLYANRVQAPLSPLIEQLREELYPEGYGNVDFARARTRLREEEVCAPPGWRLRFVHFVGRIYESIPVKPGRVRALERILDFIEFDARATHGAFLSPVSGLLNLIALRAARGESSEWKRGVESLREWMWADEEEGLRIAGARSMSWDTAFSLQALVREHPPPKPVTADRLEKASLALRAQQILDAPPGFARFHRADPTGGFCFGHGRHGWPVSDCTAEALVALHRAGRAPLFGWRLEQAVRFILSCQNADGGFGTYEARRTGSTLDWLNPAEMFGNSMTEYSWVECTAACIEALATVAETTTSAARAVRRGELWLRAQQRPGGSWAGGWGVGFLYGTFFGIRGLAAAGARPEDPAILAAGRWIASRQHSDGGWGEHFRSALLETDIDQQESHCVQTAWALLGLLSVPAPPFRNAIAGGIAFLCDHLGEDGQWPPESGAGIFFKSAVLDYRLYRCYFPLWALSVYLDNERARRNTLPGASRNR